MQIFSGMEIARNIGLSGVVVYRVSALQALAKIVVFFGSRIWPKIIVNLVGGGWDGKL